jgi:hypothetical protein
VEKLTIVNGCGFSVTVKRNGFDILGLTILDRVILPHAVEHRCTSHAGGYCAEEYFVVGGDAFSLCLRKPAIELQCARYSVLFWSPY